MVASGNKRVKGKRIYRNFIIGSEAWVLTPQNRPPNIPPDHTKGWRLYVKSVPGGPDLTSWLRKVQFKIFHTYENPMRSVEYDPTAPRPEPPKSGPAPPTPEEVRKGQCFYIEETGWGGFHVDIRLHFAPQIGEKAVWRAHYLQLEPYGDDALRAQQEKEGRVVSEVFDVVEFNEPYEAAFDALTAESQFDYLKQPRGKGKGRSGALSGAEEGDGSAELPEKPGQGNPYCREMEVAQLDVVREAERKVEREMEALEKKRAEVEERLAAFKGAKAAA